MNFRDWRAVKLTLKHLCRLSRRLYVSLEFVSHPYLQFRRQQQRSVIARGLDVSLKFVSYLKSLEIWTATTIISCPWTILNNTYFLTFFTRLLHNYYNNNYFLVIFYNFLVIFLFFSLINTCLLHKYNNNIILCSFFTIFFESLLISQQISFTLLD